MWCSSACSAAAATTPACRMPPPTFFLQRCAPAISSREPTNAEPIGAPSPFEKQTDTESNGAAIARAVGLIPHLKSRGVLATGLYRLRFVTHLDVDAEGVDRATAAVREYLN